MPKLLLRKERDATTVDRVRKENKDRLKAKEKPARLRFWSRSRIGREWHKDFARDHYEYGTIDYSDSNGE